jgi:succinate dehydrogenase/fumarate reductase flavoprotein subunit
VEKDVVVIGSGGAGLSAAVTAAKAGLDVLVVEKTQYFGGTTALSGGGIWIPGNHLAAAAGLQDSSIEGLRYIEALVGDKLRRDVLETFIENAPGMLRFMHKNTDVRFSLHPDQPDYYKDYAGAKLDGRVLDPVDFDGRDMNRDDLVAIRPPLKEFNAPMGFMIGFPDISHLMNAKKSLTSLLHVLKLFARYAKDRLSYPRGTHLTMGNALIARLLVSARKAGVTFWRNAPMTRLIIENGRVTGAEVNRNGKLETIRVRRSVVLASGGFSQNEEMRKEFIPYPEYHVSFLPEGNTGDGIKAGIAAGGGLELGLKVSGIAQVLAKDDTPIEDLYACGLDMNVLWRSREPSHGSYNGLGLTFGYVVGQQLAAKN